MEFKVFNLSVALVFIFLIGGCQTIPEAQSTLKKPRQNAALVLDGKELNVYWDDGDTFEFREHGRKTRARLRGFNTLESYGPFGVHFPFQLCCAAAGPWLLPIAHLLLRRQPRLVQNHQPPSVLPLRLESRQYHVAQQSFADHLLIGFLLRLRSLDYSQFLHCGGIYKGI